MGAFLSQPNVDVDIETGSSDNGIQFYVGAMQGWRKTMEDSHIAYPDLVQHIKNGEDQALPIDPSTISVFGVFDGHGGNTI